MDLNLKYQIQILMDPRYVNLDLGHEWKTRGLKSTEKYLLLGAVEMMSMQRQLTRSSNKNSPVIQWQGSDVKRAYW